MIVQHNVTIDVVRQRKTVVRVVQEDSARQIRLTLLRDSVPYDVSEGISDTILTFVEFKKADGHSGMYDTTSTGETAVELEDSDVPNVWLVNLDGQCFTAPGWTQINVRFETEAGMRIHTFAIMADVEPTASSDTESTDWGELNSIADLRNAVSAMWDKMFSPDAKVALLRYLKNISYFKDEHASEYYDELEAALFQTAEIVSISAVFEQGSAVIYDTDDLDTLRQYLTVTATYEDLSEREITGYTLSGTLTEGTSTITVSYGGNTATFDVDVTHRLLPIEYQQVEYIESSNTGTGPYFRFLFDLPDEFVLRTKTFQASHITSSADPFIGAQLSGQTYYAKAELGYAGNTENRLYFWSGSSAFADMQNGAYGKPLVIEARLSSTAPNKVLTVTSDQETVTNSNTSENRSDFTHVIIFGHAYNPFAGRIYYLRVETLSGDAIMNLIPCYRISDGVIGMYDLVSNTFRINDAASGTFTKGGDVQ